MGGMRRRWPLTGSALSSTLARWTQPGFVKSVQRGTIAITAATSNTATITAVDPSNSRLRFLGSSITANDNDAQARMLLTFTNGTTITATVTTSPGADTATASFEVTEYYPGVIKSIQRGTITTASVLSNTATITGINVLKADLDLLGQTSNLANFADSTTPYLVLTNSTTVTANIGVITGGTQITGFQVVEWF